MPKQAKFICYKHRHVSKRSGLCPVCQNHLYCVGDRARIPKKDNDAAWKQFRDWVLLTRNYDLQTSQHIGPRGIVARLNSFEAQQIGRNNNQE